MKCQWNSRMKNISAARWVCVKLHADSNNTNSGDSHAANKVYTYYYFTITLI